MKDVSWQMGCQFGNHSEAFLWHGSSSDEVDLAIMELIRLSELDIDSALEIADEIGSLLSRAKDKKEYEEELDLETQ